MSSGEVRRVSRQDIQLVQNLIERCLQLYMNQKEVMETLLAQAKIEPSFTELVWQKLEEENQEFFRAYNIRLVVKRQITIFNKLLEKQAELMCKIGPAGAAMQPISNGSHASALHQTPACYVSENKLPPSSENMHHQFAPNASNSLLNNELSLHKMLHSAANTSACAKRMDVLPNMISAQDPQMGTIQGINGLAIKSESGYSNSSAFTYGADGNVLGAHSTIGDASVASLSTVESNSQHLDEPLLDTDSSSFGFLGQIPRNFSLSDLTADFSQSSDILENYCRSPYLGADTYNFLDPMDKGECPDRR